MTYLGNLLPYDDQCGQIGEEMKSPNSRQAGEEHFNDGHIWPLSLEFVRGQSIGCTHFMEDLLFLLLLTLLWLFRAE